MNQPAAATTSDTAAAGGPAPVLSGRVLHPAAEGIAYGPGSVERELRPLLTRCGVRRPFLVTTPSVVRAGLAAEVGALLGDGLVGVFDGSRAHTPEPVVLEAAAAARAAGADGLVALGGSSVVDLVKGVALVLAEGEDLARLRVEFRAGDPARNRRPSLDAPKLPQVAVPTTLSGAEFTGFAGITDPVSGVKHLYRDAKLTPRWVILDPEMARATPPSLWAATGMKVLSDTVEVLCTGRATPLSDAVATGALAMLVADLGPATADPDDLGARGRCQFAVGMALPQLAMVGAGLVAAIRHQLGGGLGLDHGVASTIVLPHVLRWNRPACEPKLQRAAAAAGADSGPAAVDRFITHLEQLTVILGLPTRLRDVGVDRQALGAVAEHVLGDGSVATNPRRVTGAGDVLEILHAAW